jgi:L-arabinose isomerase
MAEGYGFGAEGDWKTCALLRMMKVIADGLGSGTSFMEDYTYHLNPSGSLVLGAHMLEVCESIAAGKPSLEIHPLGIGGKEDPVRLVFDARPAGAQRLGRRPGQPVQADRERGRCRQGAEGAPQAAGGPGGLEMPPGLQDRVRRVDPRGGAHHTAFSYAVTAEHLRDFRGDRGVELVLIDADTRLTELEKELRWNEAYFQNPRAHLGRA